MAWVDPTGETVPASEVGVGVAVIVAPGAQVPADGVVTSGHSAANEAMITGDACRPARHRFVVALYDYLVCIPANNLRDPISVRSLVTLPTTFGAED